MHKDHFCVGVRDSPTTMFDLKYHLPDGEPSARSGSANATTWSINGYLVSHNLGKLGAPALSWCGFKTDTVQDLIRFRRKRGRSTGARPVRTHTVYTHPQIRPHTKTQTWRRQHLSQQPFGLPPASTLRTVVRRCLLTASSLAPLRLLFGTVSIYIVFSRHHHIFTTVMKSEITLILYRIT